MKRTLIAGLVLLSLLTAGSASAAITDFALKPEIGLPGAPGPLAVTPNDRFVLVLDDTNNAINVLDTWNWKLLTGDISLAAAPIAITLSPEGDAAFVTLANNQLVRLGLTGLNSLGLDGVVPAITPTTVVFTGPLGDVAAVPLGGSATDSCVFVIDGDNLKWFKESAPGTVADFTPTNCLAREVEGGGKYAFVLCDDGAAGINATLQQIECAAGGPVHVTVPMVPLGADGEVLGLSLAADGEWLLVGDTVNRQLILVDAQSALPGTSIEDSFTVPAAMSEVLAVDFDSETTGPIAFSLPHSDLLLAQLNSTPTAFSGNTVGIGPSLSGGGYLARSSGVDQYMYLSYVANNSVAAVTANPWVEITSVSVIAADTASAEQVTVNFRSDQTGSFEIKLTPTFDSIGSASPLTGGTGTVLSTDNPKSVTLSAAAFGDGNSNLTVEVTASGRTGRDAWVVAVDQAPNAVPFSLDFGTRKIIINFDALSAADLETYDIYYGTNCDVPALDYALLNGDSVSAGNPRSPITVTHQGGKHYEIVVEGLENGVTYCAQIVATDASGKLSVSVRKQVTVERVITLTGRAGEDGGFDCFGSLGSRGYRSPAGAAVAGLPALGLWLFKLARKRRKNL